MKSKIFKYIYAMLCLLPAIAVGITCAYVVNNQNAYQSYDSTSTYEYESTSFNDLVVGETYAFRTESFIQFETAPSTTSGINLMASNVYFSNASGYVSARVGFLWNSSTRSIRVQVFYDNTSWDRYSFDTIFNFTFTLEDIIGVGNFYQVVDSYLYKVNVTESAYLDNVFYYSLDKVENSSVFSWVKSNFLYSGVNQFVGIFGGTNSNISFYLTWVLTISLCYLGFEVLMLFINMARNLIHSFTDKDRW